MSLILCRQEPVLHPYYIEKLGIHIGSSPELCYILYNHPLLAMDGLLDEPFIDFIRTELDLPVLAEKLENQKKSGEDPDEMIITVLQDCYYYTAKEVQQLRQKIASYRKMDAAVFMKEMADYYFNIRQYGTAIIYYEKILDGWRIQSHHNEFTSNVWNNIGACYAGIFWFEKALTAYDMSYNFHKSQDTLKNMFQLVLLNPELVLKERYCSLMTEEQKTLWKSEFDEIMKSTEEKEEIKELERLFQKEANIRAEKEKQIIQKWKQDYRKMI